MRIDRRKEDFYSKENYRIVLTSLQFLVDEGEVVIFVVVDT